MPKPKPKSKSELPLEPLSAPQSTSVAVDGVDVVTGEPPVPISLWRTATTDTDLPDQIGARLAAAIITSYANPGHTVVDRTNSPSIADACAQAGRQHTTAPEPGMAALVVADRPATDEATAALFSAAAGWLLPGGCLILVDPPQAGPVDQRPVHAAASQVGLDYFQHIVAVGAPAEGERFVFYPTKAELAAAADPTGSGHVRVHRDLRVYLRRAGGPDA